MVGTGEWDIRGDRGDQKRRRNMGASRVFRQRQGVDEGHLVIALVEMGVNRRRDRLYKQGMMPVCSLRQIESIKHGSTSRNMRILTPAGMGLRNPRGRKRNGTWICG